MNIGKMRISVKKNIGDIIGSAHVFRKLITAFIAIIIVPQCISYYISQKTSNELIVGQLSSETMSSIQLVSDSIDSLLKRMSSIALYVNEDKNIKELLTSETGSAGDTPEAENLRKLSRINRFNSIISNLAFNMVETRCYITITTAAGQKYTNWASGGSSADDYFERYMSDVGLNKKTDLIWKGIEENYIESGARQYPYVITLIKNIYDPRGETQYGTFIISVPESEFSRLLAARGEEQKRVIFDRNGIVVSSILKDWLNLPFHSIPAVEFPASGKGFFITNDEDGEKVIVSYNTVRDWKIVDIKSYSDIIRQQNKIRTDLLISNMIFVLFFLVISVMITQSISKEYMAKERKKRESEIKLLQAQISPHFLFNTLNTVRWAAINNNTQKVADMVLALSNLLRMTIVKGDELIHVEEEIENLKNYAAIFQMRHSISFSLVCRIDEDIMQYKIPKLLLQPLVENAIIHGFEGILTGGIVELTGARREGHIILSVKDNGIGMDTGSAYEGDIKGLAFSGIGAKNVDERIKLYYGEKYGLKIKSGFGEGTTVEIWLPETEAEAKG